MLYEVITLCLQKNYSLLNWQMGGGKPAASYAWAKYNLKQRSARNIFVLSAAISINLTWVPFMEKHKENYIFVKSPADIKKIKPGMFVLLSLSRLTGKSVAASDGKKYKMNLYKFLKEYVITSYSIHYTKLYDTIADHIYRIVI